MRQMEGRALAADAVGKSPGGPAKYDKAAASGGLLALTPAAYGVDTDIQMAGTEENGASEKKSKKVCFTLRVARLTRVELWGQAAVLSLWTSFLL